ncbi:FAR1-related sequence 5-like protein [Tanacetum coccineum]|uniref:FAR1-related sequence 5-like protein n=1 Tax=Tanacetum coccineum TaxID=301880 RepID=A0ABQ5D961_9ASTR
MRTPRPTLYEQNETPGGSIYWEPHIEGIPIPVEGTYYDTIDEALDMYTKYAEMTGFEIKKGGQRLAKSGAVQYKYIYCNKEGVPKGINVDTLDLEYNDKQKRNTTTHVTGCKARIRLVRNTVNGRYKLEQFQPKHNHMLIPKEYKHFTKKQRKMNQSEKMFVVKAATNKIGVTHAHNLLCSMKGGYEYVHGTTGDFKNHQRDANVFIGESDTQMLINKMENRKMYVPNFTFQYRVEKSELVAMFWADEVAKCNYKEFGDIVSFDATFNNNKEKNKRRKLKQWEKQRETIRFPVIGIESHEISIGSHVIMWNLMRLVLNHMRFPWNLIKDEGKMGAYVEKLKILLDEVKADMPNPPSRNTGDVIGGIFSITKPNQIAVQNPTKAVNKGEHLKKGERLKSEREKALKVGKKKLRIHSESHEIQSESLWITSDSL